MEHDMESPSKELKKHEAQARAFISRARESTSSALHKHPVLTVAGVGSLGLAAALYVGAGPAAVAGGAAFLAYRWLKRSPGPLYEPRESHA
jgi:hypothetical protein